MRFITHTEKKTKPNESKTIKTHTHTHTHEKKTNQSKKTPNKQAKTYLGKEQ